MADRPEDFSQLEAAMIAAGEEGSGRAEILERIAAFLERDALLRKRLQGAMTYPATAIVFALAMCLFILLWLIPTFSHFYTDYHVDMPLIMLIVLGVSSVLKSPLTWLGLGLLGTVSWFSLNRYLSTPEGALRFDKISQADLRIFGINLWPFGEIRRKTIASRVARALASLLKSGVHIDKALDTVVPVAQSPLVGTALQKSREMLNRGKVGKLTEAIRLFGALDSYFMGFLEIGEKSAQIPEMLECVARYYDQDVETQLQMLPEKLLVLIVMLHGWVVFLLAYLVYVPMATLSSGIH